MERKRGSKLINFLTKKQSKDTNDIKVKLSPEHKDDGQHKRDDNILVGEKFYHIESAELSSELVQ